MKEKTLMYLIIIITWSLRKQPFLGRKTKEIALFAGVMSVRQVCDHTINLSRTKKSINIIINDAKGRMFGYDNPLPTVHGVCHSS